MLTWNKNTLNISPAKICLFRIRRELQCGVGSHPEPQASPGMPKEGEQGLSKYLPSKMGPSWLQGVPQGGVTTSQKTLATEEVVCLQGKSSVQCTNIQIMTKTELMAFHWVLVRKGVFPLPVGGLLSSQVTRAPPSGLQTLFNWGFCSFFTSSPFDQDFSLKALLIKSQCFQF